MKNFKIKGSKYTLFLIVVNGPETYIVSVKIALLLLFSSTSISSKV